MSHISVMKTVFADQALLLEVLRALGYTDIQEGENLTISDGIKTVKVDFLVNVPYSDPIGIRKGKNGGQLAADWFRVNLNKKKFTDSLKQQYAYLSVKKSLLEQGYQITEETRDEGQRIHLMLRKVE